MNLVPLKDKIVVRPIKEKIESKSGIVIPETISADLPQKGEVIAVGKGKITAEGKLLPMEVKVGDKVLFTKYSPTAIKNEDEELFILSESDVLAIIK
ncbi:MAG TPA: co-chaperone GroES [Patescibacteria group bacterium]|nr:co-chaperone GroES [Patescibacteria group bacterium]